jgi:hypothetical protein
MACRQIPSLPQHSIANQLLESFSFYHLNISHIYIL